MKCTNGLHRKLPMEAAPNIDTKGLYGQSESFIMISMFENGSVQKLMYFQYVLTIYGVVAK